VHWYHALAPPRGGRFPVGRTLGNIALPREAFLGECAKKFSLRDRPNMLQAARVAWWEFTEFRERGVPFALDAQGVWRSVDEVPRGRACGCVCPDCRGPVIARHGQVRVHHFAHDDRRECRHALEASLFGMAVQLLTAPTAVLRLPTPDVSGLAPDLTVSPEELDSLNLPALLARGTIRLPHAVARVNDLRDSTPDAPDIVVPSLRLAIHLLSHRKTMPQAKAAPHDSGHRVLGLNLRDYLQTWWTTCDAEQDAKARELTEARGAMQKWIGAETSGRGWLHHPELEAAARQLEQRSRRERAEREAALERERAAAAARELARRRAQEEAQRRLAAEESARRRAAEEQWRIAPVADAAAADEVMKAVTPGAEAWLTPSLAANYHVQWHRGLP
jgi:hypothetical protein